MSSGLQEARRLLQYSVGHQVISLYLDLDPERFATAPARASQTRSLLDEAGRLLDGLEDLDHAELVALREDLNRIDDFLSAPEAPFKGARSLAVFCSGLSDLFEVVQLARPVPGRVVIEPTPYVEPMVAAQEDTRWMVALVNRHSAWVLTGSPERLRERERLDGGWRTDAAQGGWSQARYERSVEKEAMDHLRNVAETVNRRWRRERPDRIALGGPQEAVARFKELLADEVRSRVVPERVDVDITSASEAQIRAAVEEIVGEDEQRTETEALERLSDGVGAGGRGVEGLEPTLEALNERRVETLLLAPDFDGPACRCSSCQILLPPGTRSCPADGSQTEELAHVREAAVEAAIAQSAEILVTRHHEDALRKGIAAILRF